MTNLQECLSYLRDIDFDRATLQAARDELASVTQRATAAMPPTLLSEYKPTSADVERAVVLAWNEAVEASAKEMDSMAHEAQCALDSTHRADSETRAAFSHEAGMMRVAAERIRALKRTT